MKTPVAERLVQFAKSKELTTRKFEQKCGLTIGFISAMRVSLSPDMLQKIINVFPDLNLNWLLLGQGAMLNTQQSPIVHQQGTINLNDHSIYNASAKEMEDLKQTLAEKERIISDLRNLIDFYKQQNNDK